MIKYLLFIFLAILQVDCYFELVLRRISTAYDVDLTDTITSQPQKNCLNKDLKPGETQDVELCHQKDLYFTIDTLVGPPYQRDDRVFELAIDISVPWTWVKEQSCQVCEVDKIPQSRSDINNFKCESGNKCEGQLLVYKKSELKKFTQQATILGGNKLLQGVFVQDQLSFAGYDPNSWQNLYEIIQNDINAEKRLQNHEKIVKLKEYKMLTAQKMIGYEKLPIQGVIGLGKMQGGKQSEQTNFLSVLLNSQEDLVPEQIFGLFINGDGVNMKEHILTVGGINPELAFQQNIENIQWIPLLQQDGGHQWRIQISSLEIDFTDINFNPKGGIKSNVIDLVKKQAVISTSTSFLAFPYDIIQNMIKIMNSYDNAGCKLVDREQQVVYCTNLSLKHDLSWNFQLNFVNEGNQHEKLVYSVSIAQENLRRKCNEDQQIATETDRYDCLLNLQVSQDDDLIILGEAFLKQHYTIFDQETNRIGLLSANDDQYWGMGIFQVKLPHLVGVFKVLAYILMAIIAAILILIFCVTPIKFGVKSFKQLVLRLTTDASAQEVKRLTQTDYEEEDSAFDDIAQDMQDEAQKEIDRMETQNSLYNQNDAI